jgi:hypothetical protein
MEFLGGNRKCEVALEFETRPSTSLSGAKQLIFNSFEKERYLWDEMIDLEDFEHRG